MALEQLEPALVKLKNAGVRMTPQRHAILSYLLETKSHPTADEIYRALDGRFPNMSVATVYNNLRMLKDIGLIKELTYGDSSSRFDANLKEHYHIICVKCGRIDDFELEENLEKTQNIAAQKTGYKALTHRLEVYGICESCQIHEQ
jgi:Fur family peroxide stress response transcriptional regulator